MENVLSSLKTQYQALPRELDPMANVVKMAALNKRHHRAGCLKFVRAKPQPFQPSVAQCCGLLSKQGRREDGKVH